MILFYNIRVLLFFIIDGDNMNNYICEECNHKFTQKDAKECPKCKSEKIKKEIPMFFGTPPINNDKCKDGVCSVE